MSDRRYVHTELKIAQRPVANRSEVRAVHVAITAALLLAAAAVMATAWLVFS